MENENVKKYDNKKYYDNFKNKNGQRLKEKFICDLCGGSYTYFNKSHHFKTKRHQNWEVASCESDTNFGK